MTCAEPVLPRHMSHDGTSDRPVRARTGTKEADRARKLARKLEKEKVAAYRSAGLASGRSWCFTAFDEAIVGRIRAVAGIVAMVVG